MATSIEFKIKDEPFYVVSILEGRDALNDFFFFRLTVRHSDQVKVKMVACGFEAELKIGELTYHCEIQSIEQQWLLAAALGGENSGHLELTLRPKQWSKMQSKTVRVFEIGQEEENLLNLQFEAEPTLDQIVRLLNQALLAEDSGLVDVLNYFPLPQFRLDLWQNQLAIQIQETNSELFKRLIWKLGASFLYNASSEDHQWVCIPDMCPIPSQRKPITENEVSKFSSRKCMINRFDRWYEDQLNQTTYLLPAVAHFVSLASSQKMDHFQTSEMECTFPIAMNQVYEYVAERRAQTTKVMMPTEVNHRYDHRTGYICETKMIHPFTSSKFDLSIIDEPPLPFNNAILATVLGPEKDAFGSRDQHMRYRVNLDFKLKVNTETLIPKAWLYRLRPDSSKNGSGEFNPLPNGGKVVLQALNGDREQIVISDSFVSKHRRQVQ